MIGQTIMSFVQILPYESWAQDHIREHVRDYMRDRLAVDTAKRRALPLHLPRERFEFQAYADANYPCPLIVDVLADWDEVRIELSWHVLIDIERSGWQGQDPDKERERT